MWLYDLPVISSSLDVAAAAVSGSPPVSASPQYHYVRSDNPLYHYVRTDNPFLTNGNATI